MGSRIVGLRFGVVSHREDEGGGPMNEAAFVAFLQVRLRDMRSNAPPEAFELLPRHQHQFIFHLR